MGSVGGPSVSVLPRIVRRDGCLEWRRMPEMNVLLMTSIWLASCNGPQLLYPDLRLSNADFGFPVGHGS